MSQYHVYGIGNALVDVEFSVDEAFLRKMNIEKGLMTLVNQARQDELLQNLKTHEGKRRSGGSAANTMIAIAQFGGKSFYSYKVGRDEYGDFYLADLKANGVTTKTTEHQLGVTGKCMVFITPDADRTMNTYLGITESFSVEEIDESALRNSEWLYIEGYLVPSRTGLPAAIKAKKIAESQGVKTALTFSDPNMVKYFREGMDQIIGEGLDLLFCNEDEALAYAKKENIEEAAKVLGKIAKQFVVTLGPRGAYLFDGEKAEILPTRPVKAIDTNGAGDLFAGAFLYALTQGYNFKMSGEFACKASSVIVTRPGARLEKDEAQQIHKEFFYGR